MLCNLEIKKKVLLQSRNEDPEEVLEAVNDLTNLGLEYYVIVKTQGFIELVDAIGGVTFNVPIDMDYDDTSQDLHIHLIMAIEQNFHRL